jgi:DNA-binding IclR family transcriptional regulator
MAESTRTAESAAPGARTRLTRRRLPAPPRAAAETRADERSRAVARVVAALEELSVAARALSNLELAQRLGVPQASMYRILRKLEALGYVECSGNQAQYGVAPRLAELGERLADAGCRAPPLRRVMALLRAETGANVTVWVRGGPYVRLAALLSGTVRGATSNAPGELAPPFSTPGLAIASQDTLEDVRGLVTQCRRRALPLGPRFRGLAEVEKARAGVRQRGFAVGYNMRGDGWGMLAWPIQVSLAPRRIGALAIGAPVAVLRREEPRLLQLGQRLLAAYLAEQQQLAARSSG